MSNSFLSSVAAAHFAKGSRQPLLKDIASSISDAHLIEALGCNIPAIQNVAWRRLVDLPYQQLESIVLGGLHSVSQNGTSGALAILKSLIHPSIPISDDVVDRVTLLMESPDVELSTAAAAVIALRQPRAALSLLKSGKSINRAVLRQLCVADDLEMILPLVNAFGFPAKPLPPTIGFLLAPEWLAENWANYRQLVEWLCHNCGYCNETIGPEALNLLSAGFSYVTKPMTSEPRLSKIAHRWQRRIRSFAWRLLPDELDLNRDDDKPFDVDDALELDLFIAAVRDTDRLAFAEQKQVPPFGRDATNRELAPTCFHASSQFTRRLFLAKPLTLAESWKIPQPQKGDFLIEWARVILESNEEKRTAADLAFRGRWRSSTKLPAPARRSNPKVQVHGKLVSMTRLLVLKDFVLPEPDHRLSPGAQSVVNLAAACGLNAAAVASWLLERETHWASRFRPLGMEIQIPLVDPDCFAAWKEALPYLGIPSPVRPEFGGMLEAAFRPVRSFHAMGLAPLLLTQLGIVAEPQDLVMHLSLQGDLKEDVRWIAFPHHFIHSSRRLRNRPDGAMSRVMSKGFVHFHPDAELLNTGDTNSGRTEFRQFRIFAEEVSGLGDEQPTRIAIARGFISDLIAVQVLGSAATDDCSDCRLLFDQYAAAVGEFADRLPIEFQQFLKSNFFESTGDPRDERLLNLVPIFCRWSAVRQIVRTQDLSSKLDLDFRVLRNHHVQLVLAHWHSDHDLSLPEVKFIGDEIELVFPDPIASSRAGRTAVSR